MKSDLINAVVSPPQEIAPPQPGGGVDLRAQAARDRTGIAATQTGGEARTAAGSEKAGAPAPVGAPAPAAGRGTGGDSGSSTSGQRVALSRTRLEAMMLEAQAASTSGDVQRARSIARAVKMEAGAIRDALRSAADADAVQADAMAAAAAARAVQDAQEAARRAAARAAMTDNREGLAPWSGGSTRRAATLAESAPLGTPTTNLHRSAFEALRRAQEILDLLSRLDAGDRSRADAAAASGGAGGALLLNQIEAEDGALLDGWNLLA